MSQSLPPSTVVPDYAASHAQWAATEASLKPFRRVARVAKFDAWTIAIFAAPTFLCGLGGISSGITGVLLGGAMAVVAFVEFKNAGRLRRLDLTALDRLGWNQLALAGLLVVYACWSLFALHGGGLLAQLKQEMPNVDLGASDADLQSLDRTLSLAVYGGLIVITVLAQGSMALYYFGRRRKLQMVLDSLPGGVVEVYRWHLA